MKNLEALMVHVLISESLNIFLDELKISLIGFNWIAQVIFINLLSLVSQEGTNSLNATG